MRKTVTVVKGDASAPQDSATSKAACAEADAVRPLPHASETFENTLGMRVWCREKVIFFRLLEVRHHSLLALQFLPTGSCFRFSAVRTCAAPAAGGHLLQRRGAGRGRLREPERGVRREELRRPGRRRAAGDWYWVGVLCSSKLVRRPGDVKKRPRNTVLQ